MRSFDHSKRIALIATFAASVAAHAQVVNGSFEQSASENSTVIPGFASVGNAFLSSTAHFSTPSDGAFQATLATALDGQYGEHAGTGTSAAAAETFLGLNAPLSSLGNGRVSEVSAIRQTLSLNAGDQLLFDFNFLTDEVYKATNPALSTYDKRPGADRNDFGFFSYAVGGASSATKLIDTFYGYSSTGPGQSDFVTGLSPTPDTDPLFSESGYLLFTFTAPTTGSYTLRFGVANGETGTEGTSSTPSGLLVDNLRIVPVPEPTSMAALGLGLLAAARRRRS